MGAKKRAREEFKKEQELQKLRDEEARKEAARLHQAEVARQRAKEIEQRRIQAAEERQARLAAMSPEEREAFLAEEARKRKRKITVVVAGGVLVVGLLALVGNMDSPSSSPTTGFVADPDPESDPAPSPDVGPEARAFQQYAIAQFGVAEEAGSRVQEHMQAILEGETSDTVQLARLAIRAAEAWEVVKFEILGRDVSPAIRDARDDLSLAASYREDAFRALIKWVDERRDTLVVEYQDGMEKGDAAMMRGLAALLTLGGIESPSP